MEQAEQAAKSFKKAMKGIGTDESRLINEIKSHSNSELQLIKQKYLTFYGKTLEEDLKSEIGGKFLEAILGLLEPVDEFEAKIVHKAIKGIGTNEKLLIETLCPKEQHEIQTLKSAYKRLFDKDLEKDIENEQGGNFGKILRTIVSAGREGNQTPIDLEKAKKEAQELYDAGQGKWGTDESEFIRILCSRSFSQLRATFEAYKILSGNDLETAIKKEMSGDLEKACLAIVKSAINKSAYFAELLHESMAGIGTKDDDLIRILVSRLGFDMQQIKMEYFNKYGKNLCDVVKSELSGNYEKIILELIGK